MVLVIQAIPLLLICILQNRPCCLGLVLTFNKTQESLRPNLVLDQIFSVCLDLVLDFRKIKARNYSKNKTKTDLEKFESNPVWVNLRDSSENARPILGTTIWYHVIGVEITKEYLICHTYPIRLFVYLLYIFRHV